MSIAEIGSSLGSIGSSIGSMGAEVGGLGSAVASVGAVSGLGRFGEVMTAPMFLPISEGLARASFLENTIPLNLAEPVFSIGSERFDLGFDVPQVVGTEVPSIFQYGLENTNLNPSIGLEVSPVFDFGLSDINLDPTVEPVSEFVATPTIPEIKPIIEPQIVPVVEPRIYPIVGPIPNFGTQSLNVTESVLGRQVKTESKQSPSIKTFAKPMTEIKPAEDTFQEVEEEVVVNKQEQEKEEESEHSEEFKLKRIVDTKAAKVRIEEIIEAAKKALRQGFGGELSRTAQGEVEEIDGAKIVENLPGQHAKNRSGELNIVDPRGYLFDGSLFLTIAKIASGKFSSLKEVFRKVPEIVYEDVPVTRGEGKGVKDEDVVKVYKDHKGKVPPAVEVFKRVIKIKKLIKIQPQGQWDSQVIEMDKKEESEGEGKIEDHQDLAKALQVN